MRRPQLDNKGIAVSTRKKRKVGKFEGIPKIKIERNLKNNNTVEHINDEIDTEVIKNTFDQVTLHILEILSKSGEFSKLPTKIKELKPLNELNKEPILEKNVK